MGASDRILPSNPIFVGRLVSVKPCAQRQLHDPSDNRTCRRPRCGQPWHLRDSRHLWSPEQRNWFKKSGELATRFLAKQAARGTRKCQRSAVRCECSSFFGRRRRVFFRMFLVQSLPVVFPVIVVVILTRTVDVLGLDNLGSFFRVVASEVPCACAVAG